MAQPPSTDCCSICHETFNIPCQANCSHWFCGSCILQVWHYGSALQPCKCPLCRSVITLLIPSESSPLPQNNPEASRVMREIEAYNRVFGERSSGFIQKLRDLPFLLRRLLNDLLDPGRSLPFVIKARVYLAMFLSVIYLLSPVDIIPEGTLFSHICIISNGFKASQSASDSVSKFYFPSFSCFPFTGVLGVIGLLDDLIILLVCFLHVAAIYRSVLVSRHGGS
ncbi:hypothetical protein V2J09_013893 [Rumex salicifolius]